MSQHYGPYENKSRGTWTVQWKEGNRAKSKTFKAEADAQAFIIENQEPEPMQESLDDHDPYDFIMCDYSSRYSEAQWWWKSHAADLATRVYAAGVLGDKKTIDMLDKAVKQFTSLARAHAAHQD